MNTVAMEPPATSRVSGLWRRKAITYVACATLITSGLTGCAGTQESRIGADDGSDSCRAYVVALDSTGNYFAEDMVKGALVGAAGGALLGGLVTGSWKGAAIGAASGAVAGAIGGYWQSKMQQGRDQAILGMVSDMQRESGQLDRTQQAFNQLSNCRRVEAARIKAQYVAKAISHDEAQGRLLHLAALARKDLDILNGITGNADKRVSEYRYAAAQIDPTVPSVTEIQPMDKQGMGEESEDAPVTKTRTHHAAHAVAAPPKPASTQAYQTVQVKESSLKASGATYATDSNNFTNLS